MVDKSERSDISKDSVRWSTALLVAISPSIAATVAFPLQTFVSYVLLDAFSCVPF